MNSNITSGQISSTVGQCVIISSLIASGVAATSFIDFKDNDMTYQSNAYIQSNNQSTFDNHNHYLTESATAKNEPFNQKIVGFYSYLLTNQEPLGEEFEKVLHENLWDLYES